MRMKRFPDTRSNSLSFFELSLKRFIPAGEGDAEQQGNGRGREGGEEKERQGRRGEEGRREEREGRRYINISPRHQSITPSNPHTNIRFRPQPSHVWLC